MSQQKVEQYKKEKKNRKKNIARQKRQAAIRNCLVTLVIAAFIGFIGFSIYKDYIYKEPSNNEPVTYSLSEKEISKVWEEYHETTTAEGETTSGEEETTSNEDTTTSGAE